MTVAAKCRPVLNTDFAATTAPDAFMEFHSAERHRSAAMRAAPTIPLPHGSPDVIDGNGTQNERDTGDSNGQFLTLQDTHRSAVWPEFGPNALRHCF